MNSIYTKEYYLAVTAILFSSAMWGLIWYPMRLLEMAGMPVVWSTLVVYLASALVASVQLYWVRQRMTSAWPPSLWGLALAAGLTNLFSGGTDRRGGAQGHVVVLPVTVVVSVAQSLVAWERISRTSMLMIVIAMSGTFMMLWHPEIGMPWPHGLADWLALFASVMFSVNNVLSRKLAMVAMEVKTTVVYWGVVMVAVVVLLLQQSALPQVSLNLWLLVMFFGGLCFTAMTISVLYGLARMPVFRSAILMLFELLVAAISAWLLTDERMTSAEWLGGG